MHRFQSANVINPGTPIITRIIKL